jgi:hypothetical protein
MGRLWPQREFQAVLGLHPGTSPWGRQRGDSLSGPFGWMAVAKVALDQRDLWLNSNVLDHFVLVGYDEVGLLDR